MGRRICGGGGGGFTVPHTAPPRTSTQNSFPCPGPFTTACMPTEDILASSWQTCTEACASGVKRVRGHKGRKGGGEDVVAETKLAAGPVLARAHPHAACTATAAWRLTSVPCYLADWLASERGGGGETARGGGGGCLALLLPREPWRGAGRHLQAFHRA